MVISFLPASPANLTQIFHLPLIRAGLCKQQAQHLSHSVQIHSILQFVAEGKLCEVGGGGDEGVGCDTVYIRVLDSMSVDTGNCVLLTIRFRASLVYDSHSSFLPLP